MRRKIGALCMLLGAALIAAALLLFVYNRRQDARAARAVEQVLPQLMQQLPPAGQAAPDPYDPAMAEVEIDGYAYIGCLTIPALGLELPVMAQWDYNRLQIAPCRYSGSIKSGDLVLAAHNYTRHFGALKNLAPGDAVYFTDMNGLVTEYAVALVEQLAPTAVQEMTAGEYALTLFTCTYSGQSRVTVRCEKVT